MSPNVDGFQEAQPPKRRDIHEMMPLWSNAIGGDVVDQRHDRQREHGAMHRPLYTLRFTLIEEHGATVPYRSSPRAASAPPHPRRHDSCARNRRK